MSKEKKAWYASWFDTPYYHTLYKDRDYEEAEVLIDNLAHYLSLEQGSKVLDLACGKGRHSIYLNKLGFDVHGADLSANSIESAKEAQNDTLHFFEHDMREPLEHKYDAIFNLFTSFGYFDNEQDNILTLKAIHQSLNDYGLAVIDFMNVHKVIENLVPQEVKTVEGIEFHIKRYHQEGYIYKDISFEIQGEQKNYSERVKAFTLEDFEQMMQDNDIYLLDTFGDYKLRKFDPKVSDRLIMIFK